MPSPPIQFTVRHIFEDWKCEWGFVDDRYLHVQEDINVFSNYAEARDLQYRKLAAGFDARVTRVVQEVGFTMRAPPPPAQ